MGIIKKIFIDFVRWILIIMLLFWSLFPIYWMCSVALRNSQELAYSLSILNKSISFENFFNLFNNEKFQNSINNSAVIAVLSLIISLLLGITSSYILQKKRFKLKTRFPILIWVLLVRIIPPITFALPLYIMMNKFGIINSKVPIILAHVLLNLPFIIWFMITFFSNISVELEESAKIDGASEFLLFMKIILPLVLPGIAAVTIFSSMTSWNEYLYSAIFVQSPSQFTIPLTLATFNSEQELTSWGKVAAGGVVSTLPVVFFTLFMQKYLISGLSSGAIKE